MNYKEIKSAICFIGGLMLIAFAFHSLLIFGLRHYKGGAEFDVWNEIMEGKASADILISGNSRALVNFDCQSIGKILSLSCYNIGLNGSRFNLELLRLKMYLKYNKKPSMVVQVVGISDLELGCIFNDFQYIPYLNEDLLYNKVVQMVPEFRYCKYIPLYSFTVYNKKVLGRAVKGIFNDQTSESDWNFGKRNRGFLSVDRPWTDEFDKFKIEFQKGKEYTILQQSVSELEEMIQLCQKNKIKVVLVFPPAYYESTSTYAKNFEEIFRVYHTTAERNRIQFLNYSQNLITKDTKYFYNSQHMNSKGTEVFSRLLAEDLIKIID